MHNTLYIKQGLGLSQLSSQFSSQLSALSSFPQWRRHTAGLVLLPSLELLGSLNNEARKLLVKIRTLQCVSDVRLNEI